MSEVRDVLIRARALIDTPEKWTQGEFARAANGDPVTPDHPPGVFYPTASTRVTELERDGMLKRTGRTRRTSQGREADVLVLTKAAEDAVGGMAA